MYKQYFRIQPCGYKFLWDLRLTANPVSSVNLSCTIKKSSLLPPLVFLFTKLNFCLAGTIKPRRLVQKTTLKKKKKQTMHSQPFSKSNVFLHYFTQSGLVACKYSDSAAFSISPLCTIVTLLCERISSHTLGLVSESCQGSFSHA